MSIVWQALYYLPKFVAILGKKDGDLATENTQFLPGLRRSRLTDNMSNLDERAEKALDIVRIFTSQWTAENLTDACQ